MAHSIDRPINGSTGPRPAVGIRLDPVRIAAESGAIAVHAVAFLLLLAPLTPPQLPPPAEKDDDIIIVDRIPPPPLPPVPVEPEITPPRPVPMALSTVAPRPELPALPIDPPVDAQPGDIVIDAEPVVDHGPVLARTEPATRAPLEYVAAPAPPYPPQALRQQLTGTVLLRVHVDIDGRPIAVDIERSSGHRVLDAAARRQVLAKWRFRPAVREGRAVEAIGLVPIDFALER